MFWLEENYIQPMETLLREQEVKRERAASARRRLESSGCSVM